MRTSEVPVERHLVHLRRLGIAIPRNSVKRTILKLLLCEIERASQEQHRYEHIDHTQHIDTYPTPEHKDYTVHADTHRYPI